MRLNRINLHPLSQGASSKTGGIERLGRGGTEWLGPRYGASAFR